MQVAETASALGVAPATTDTKHMTLVAFSGDMDKLLAALSIASSAAATGSSVTIFFTFWGLSAIRKEKRYGGKRVLDRMLNLLLPSRSTGTGLSRMNMLGAGPRFFRFLMKRKNVADVDQLVATCRMLGVRLIACSTSMEVMGIDEAELVDGVEFGGATACVQDLFDARATLFV